MSIYLNAFLMLVVTVAAFVLLAKLFQAIRSRRLLPAFGINAPRAAAQRLVIEESCAVDGKRRLLLVRCDQQRVLLLTGGPADLVVSLFPALPAADASR
jgi:flagellar protein FliO/FliZ